MADFTTALFTRLSTDPQVSGVIGTKVYPTIVPQDKALPYIRYQIVSDPRPEHLGGYDRARAVRVQVDCFATSYVTARGLAEKVITAMTEPATVAGVQFGHTKAEGPRDLGEDVAGMGFVHRASVDLLVEHRVV